MTAKQQQQQQQQRRELGESAHVGWWLSTMMRDSLMTDRETDRETEIQM
jgi:hypothetical protein